MQFAAAIGAVVVMLPGLLMELANLLIEDPAYRALALLGVLGIAVLRLWNQRTPDVE